MFTHLTRGAKKIARATDELLYNHGAALIIFGLSLVIAVAMTQWTQL